MNLFKYRAFCAHRFVLALAFFMVSYLAMAQSTNILSPSYRSNSGGGFGGFTYGGNIGVNYTTYGIGANVSPRLGYKITNDLEVAVLVNGTLHHTEYYRNLSVSAGPSLSYYIGRMIYLSSSFQHYFVSQKNKQTNATANTQENALYVGGGYMQSLGNRVYVTIGASYNVLYKKDSSVFGTGFVPHVGIVVGL